MGKPRDTKKEVKKKPTKTIKEKRKEKQEKKKGLRANVDVGLKEERGETLGASKFIKHGNNQRLPTLKIYDNLAEMANFRGKRPTLYFVGLNYSRIGVIAVWLIQFSV